MTTEPEHTFGRLEAHAIGDDQDALYSFRASLPVAAPALPRYRYWSQFFDPLNQGGESTCFPAGTLIRMADGSHRPIEDIKLLDEVVTAEGNTGRVLQAMVRFHGPGLVKLNLWGHRHLRMTAEHPVLTKTGYKPVSALIPGDYVALTRYLAPVQSTFRTDDYVTAAETKRATQDGRITYHGPAGVPVVTQVAPLPAEIRLTPGFGRIAGLYMAEGSAATARAIWTFGSHERDTLVQELVALLRSELHVEPRIQERPNNSIKVVVGGKQWSLLFARLFGMGAANKGVPAALMAGGQDFLAAVLGAWLDGDGYSRRGSKQGVSVSHRLVMDMHAIATAIGLKPAVRITKTRPSGAVRTRRPRWDLVMADGDLDNYRSEQTDTHVWRRVVGLEFEDFAGPVYNLTVEGDNSYVAEGIGVHNCVAHALKHWMMLAPTVQTSPKRPPFPRDIYDDLILIDEWTANDSDPSRSFGTSVRAAFKWAQRAGYVGEYRWALNAQDLIEFVSLVSPVQIGIGWFDGMMVPDAQGFIHPTGAYRGGHSVLVVGRNNIRHDYTILNSWGTGWGRNGRARILDDELHRLIFEQGGEAAAGLERRLG